MSHDELIRDPVFQLNLLLWMAKEQPREDWRVRPLFWESGFAVLYVEQPFRFPVETTEAIQSSGLEISVSPESDLILARQRNGKALYFEAKANSFGTASSDCQQARGHLLAAGPAFAETYEPLNACLLCYVLPSEGKSAMAKCLRQLAESLAVAKLAPGTYSVHGLSVNAGDLAYSWDEALADYLSLPGSEATVLRELSDDTDPTPLLLVYTDEDCPNPKLRDFYRRAMLDRVRARLLCDLQAHEAGTPSTITLDDLLRRTTERVFEYLGRERQNSLRRLVRAHLLVPICDRWRDRHPGRISMADDTLTVRWTSASEEQEFLDWLEDRATVFPADKLPAEGPGLFDGIDAPQGQGSATKEE